MAIPSTPFVTRSSMIRFCSAAVPSDVILNSAVISGNSLSAFSTPRRAMVQKSEELLVTNASFNSRPVVFPLLSPVLELQAAIKMKKHEVTTVASCLIAYSFNGFENQEVIHCCAVAQLQFEMTCDRPPAGGGDAREASEGVAHTPS